jgi:hypothetical protein
MSGAAVDLSGNVYIADRTLTELPKSIRSEALPSFPRFLRKGWKGNHAI